MLKATTKRSKTNSDAKKSGNSYSRVSVIMSWVSMSISCFYDEMQFPVKTYSQSPKLRKCNYNNNYLISIVFSSTNFNSVFVVQNWSSLHFKLYSNWYNKLNDIARRVIILYPYHNMILLFPTLS